VGHIYVMSARKVVSGKFRPEPGEVLFLKVPDTPDRIASPSDAMAPKRWFDEVQAAAKADRPTRTGAEGDVVVFVHGYNNDARSVLRRHRFLSEDLAGCGYQGAVVVFDWPSDDSTLNYLEDRSDAAATSRHLVEQCVVPFSERQEQGCKINVHLLGHSTGAYVICEAFAQAEKNGELYKKKWRVDQIAFIAGDVSAKTLTDAEQWSRPMFDRCVRVTNYFSGYDHVLAVSNAKRFGTSPRAGRVGAPAAGRHPKVANVDCGPLFAGLDPRKQRFTGTYAHSWYIGNKVWALDFLYTVASGLDRHVIPTREAAPDGAFRLREADPLRFQALWAMEKNQPK